MNDIENIAKAIQTADLLGQDLQQIVQSDNLLLSHLAMQELAEIGRMRSRLAVIQYAVQQMEDQKCAR